MAGPWDDYATQTVSAAPVEDGPWSDFSAPVQQEEQQGAGEYLSNKFLQGAHSVIGGGAFVAGGLLNAIGAEDASDTAFGFMEHLQDTKATGTTTDDDRHGLPLRVAGAVSTAIPALAGFLVNPAAGIAGMTAPSFSDAGANTKEGLSAATTGAILGVDALTNMAGFKLPAAVGGSLGKKILSGAAINLALGAAGDEAKHLIAGQENEEVAKKYDPTNLDARIADVLFGGVAGAYHKPSTKPQTTSIKDILKEVDKKSFGTPLEGDLKRLYEEWLKTNKLEGSSESQQQFLETQGKAIDPVTANMSPDEFARLNQKTQGMSLEELPKVDKPAPKVDDGTIDFEKVAIGEVPREQQGDLLLDQGVFQDFKKHATPEQGVDFIDTLQNDLTDYNKGEPAQMDLPLINEQLKPLLGGTGKKGFGQGGAVDFAQFFDNPKEMEAWVKRQEQGQGTKTTNNASGESSASVEAINRLKQQNEAGIKQYEFDPDRRELIPLTTADRVDKRATNGKAIVQVDKEGNFTVLDNKSKYNQEPLQNLFKASEKPDAPRYKGTLGGVGKKQGGAVNFNIFSGLGQNKPQTLEKAAKTLNAQQWTNQFLKEYPQYEGKPEIAAEVYKRLTTPPEQSARTIKEYINENASLKGLDHLLGATSTRIGNISQSVLHRTLRYEKDLLTNTHKAISTADPFLSAINKLPKNTKKIVDNLLLNNDTQGLNRVLDSINKPELKAEYAKIRSVLDDIGAQLKEHGRVENLRVDYFPRIVKDVQGLLKALDAPFRTTLETSLKDARTQAAKLGQDFTPAHESKIINTYLRNRLNTQYKPGFSKERKINEVAPDLEKYYATPTEGFHSYVRNAISEIETSKFFARNGVIDPKTGKLDVDASIGEITAKEIRDGKMSIAQAVELESLLKSRFGPGNQSSNAFVQGFKDLSNIGLLGSFTSAITQGGDVAASVYINGLRPTLMSVIAQARGRNAVSMKDFGLVDHISQEFVSQRASSKILNKLFETTGFAAIDKLGKTTLLDSTLRSAQSLVKTPSGQAKLAHKWKDRFGDEYPQLVADLKAGDKTELTDMLVFSQLSKVQPITKIEQAQAYLDNPNGRLFYMLKTFMLKQMDLIRNDAYNEIKRGNVREGLGNLMRYSLIMGSAGATTDYVKNWILGRDVNPVLSDVPLNVLKIFGLNEFNRSKLAEGKVAETVRDTVIPPYQMFDVLLQTGMAALDPEAETIEKAWNYVPWAGNWYYNKFLEGADKYNERKENEEE